jgi:hypothetical protein
VLRGQSERFVPEKILRQRTRNGQRQYLVKWEQYPDIEATWEIAENIEQDVSHIVHEFTIPQK